MYAGDGYNYIIIKRNLKYGPYRETYFCCIVSKEIGNKTAIQMDFRREIKIASGAEVITKL